MASPGRGTPARGQIIFRSVRLEAEPPCDLNVPRSADCAGPGSEVRTAKVGHKRLLLSPGASPREEVPVEDVKELCTELEPDPLGNVCVFFQNHVQIAERE